MKFSQLLAFGLMALMAWSTPVLAGSKKDSAGSAQGERQRNLDFEGDVVEGMNRQPLDSLTSLNEGNGDRSKGHIYRRKKKFKPENRELAREIVETY